MIIQVAVDIKDATQTCLPRLRRCPKREQRRRRHDPATKQTTRAGKGGRTAAKSTPVTPRGEPEPTTVKAITERPARHR
jgi:hypothetical protein